MEHREPYHTDSLETCIRHRHSIRVYKPEPVDPVVLHECLALAQLAPSNSNIQNWRLHIATGAARERIVAALTAAAAEHGPELPPLPEQFRPYRSAMGHQLYGSEGYGIAPTDRAGAKAASARNFEFFGAPVAAVITMNKDLTPMDALSVGLYIQTLMLLLTERGLGTCLQGSVAGFPDVLRKEFRLPEDQLIICGMAIGHPAPEAKVNSLIIDRDDVDRHVTFLNE